MARILYSIGDTIVLRQRALASNQPSGAGEIISVLPETRGAVTYRVRFRHENFDRNIDQDSIDTEASSSSDKTGGPVSYKTGKSWIDPGAIKTRK